MHRHHSAHAAVPLLALVFGLNAHYQPSAIVSRFTCRPTCLPAQAMLYRPVFCQITTILSEMQQLATVLFCLVCQVHDRTVQHGMQYEDAIKLYEHANIQN